MFTFLGVFADHRELAQHLKDRWPAADVRTLRDPFDGVAVRIREDDYADEDEDEERLPTAFLSEVTEFSRRWAETRFLVLRTWCWGGDCFNDGRILEGGVVTHSATDNPHPAPSHALQYLVTKMGGTIDRSGFFDPLRRDFDWTRNT